MVVKNLLKVISVRLQVQMPPVPASVPQMNGEVIDSTLSADNDYSATTNSTSSHDVPDCSVPGLDELVPHCDEQLSITAAAHNHSNDTCQPQPDDTKTDSQPAEPETIPDSQPTDTETCHVQQPAHTTTDSQPDLVQTEKSEAKPVVANDVKLADNEKPPLCPKEEPKCSPEAPTSNEDSSTGAVSPPKLWASLFNNPKAKVYWTVYFECHPCQFPRNCFFYQMLWNYHFKCF